MARSCGLPGATAGCCPATSGSCAGPAPANGAVTPGIPGTGGRTGRPPAPAAEDDQVIVCKDQPKGTSAADQLAVCTRLEGGHWRIVDIRAR